MSTLDEVIEAMAGAEFGESLRSDRRATPEQRIRIMLLAAQEKGWKLTPKRATDEMLDLADEHWTDEPDERWARMHEASPSVGAKEPAKCAACGGSGRYDNDGSPPCGACNGTGRE